MARKSYIRKTALRVPKRFGASSPSRELKIGRRQNALDQVVLENVAEGVLVFDAKNKLVVFNRQLLDMFRLPEGSLKVGQTRASQLRLFASLGIFGPGSEEYHVRKRRYPTQSNQSEELRLPGERVIEVQRRALPDGGQVATFYDITEIWRRREVLDLAMKRLKKLAALKTAILNALPSNIALLARDGTIIAVNESWRVFAAENGLSDEQRAVGQNYLEVAEKAHGEAAELAARAVRGIRSVLKGRRRHFSLKYPCHAPDKERWFQMYVAPVAREGQTEGAIVMHLDVTEQVRAEQKLLYSEQRFRAIFNGAGDAILTLDTEGHILTANPMAATYFGCAVEDIVGRRADSFFPDLKLYGQPDGDPAVVPRSWPSELSGRRHGGARFPAEAVISRVYSNGNEFFTVSFRDISERRAMEEQLAQANKLSTLGEMAAGMAHELNQPLNVMRMAADNALIRMERGTAPQKYLQEALELISGQSERMGEMIMNLKIFARREEHAHDVYFSPADAVRAAVQLLRGQFKLDSVEIQLHSPETVSRVRGAGTHFEQVIINVLSNARDAILDRGRRHEQGSACGLIRISVADLSACGQVSVLIEDNGTGIPDEVMPRIFDPFFTTKKVGNGTGLGLSISYGIVESMGGRISAGNTGDGAKIEIFLPVSGAAVEVRD